MKLDADGNLDTGYLAKELSAALQYDIHYKQVDNMKKKAVKTSGTYDEFKAMVACSHLKTLTSKEVESLSAKKTGWQREFQSSSAFDAHILSHEAKKSDIELARSRAQAKQGAKAAAALDSFRVPKTLAVLESDVCRTLRNKEVRVQYLLALGLKRLKLLLKGDKDCTPELLEALLDTALHAATLAASQLEAPAEVGADTGVEAGLSAAASAAAAEGAGEGAGAQEPEPTVQSDDEFASAEKKEKKMDVYKWLKAVSSFPRFFIAVLFVPKTLLDAAVAYLTEYQVSKEGTEEEVLAAEAQRQEVLSRFLPK